RSANDPASLQRAVAEVFGEIGGRGNDVAGADAFAELKPIPAELAQKMIQALSSSGNQPIGEQPRSKASPAPNAGAQTPPANSPQPLVAHASAKRVVLPALFGLSCFGIVCLFVLLLIVKAIKKS